MIFMVEKVIKGGIFHPIHRYAKANNKYMKDCDKNKKQSYFEYWDVNNLYGWAMSQKLPVTDFEWFEDVSKTDKSFIESYNEESDKEYFLEVDIQYLQIFIAPTITPTIFTWKDYRKRWNLKKVEKLAANLQDNPEYFIHIRNLK